MNFSHKEIDDLPNHCWASFLLFFFCFSFEEAKQNYKLFFVEKNQNIYYLFNIFIHSARLFGCCFVYEIVNEINENVDSSYVFKLYYSYQLDDIA
jgi:hypothetical protein